MITNSSEATNLRTNVVFNNSEAVRQKLMHFVVATFTIFLFTLKFELVNNLIILLLLFGFRKEVTLPKESLILLACLGLILVPFFIFFNNFLYLKYILYAIRLLLILFLANSLFSITTEKKKLNSILEFVFFVHVFAILICFLSPVVNNVFRSLFSYSTGSEFRITGFIQGYEFVPYFILIHLAYYFKINNQKFSLYFLFKLILGTFAIIVSGRFGLVPLSFFILILFFKTFDLIIFFLFVGLCIAFSSLLSSQISNVANTAELVVAILQDVDNINESNFSNEQFDGQYNLSPLTFYYEFIKPFVNWQSYLFPGPSYLVDSGPSYLALNFGFVFAFLLYLFYFKFFKVATKLAIPGSIMIIVLLVDFKFRSIFTLFPAIWLILNHLNYKFQNSHD